MSDSAASRMALRLRDGADGSARELTLDGELLQVGRGADNDLAFTDARVSSIHGRLVLDGQRLRYQDLGSTNGSALIRDGREHPLAPAPAPGTALRIGDEIRLGDADRPSTIELMALQPGPAAPGPRTVVAGRALGEPGRLPAAETLRRLLQLLARLRSEQDGVELARQVMAFCLETLPAAARAECAMRDDQNRFAPVLALGPDGESTTGTPPPTALLERLESDREALRIEDLHSAPDASSSIRDLPGRSLLLAPLLIDDRLIGTLQIGSSEDGRFRDDDLDLVAVLGQQLAGVLAGSRMIRKLRDAEGLLRDQCDYLKRRLGQRPALEEMVGSSEPMQRLRRGIQAVAPSRTTVLIRGETGTGKELVARALHESSPRAAATFAAVNCSALAAGLLESELFGHVRGAFTGAHRRRKGLFEVAHGGTLLLDEVGDMPAALQPKLLRVLEAGAITPVGDSRARPVDVRVVAATHRDLQAEVAAGRFRQDLLFRLDVFAIEVPPLRQRTADVLVLARHFLAHFAAEQAKPAPDLTPEAAAVLQACGWPGNVRELKNEMERASLLAPAGANIDASLLSERVHGGGERPAIPLDGPLKQILERLEAEVLRGALQRHGDNRTRCARALGISRQALVAKIQRLGVVEKP